MVERLCLVRDYTFIGWVGSFTNASTYLYLRNNKTGSEWKSTSIDKFRAGRGDPRERTKALIKSVRISDEQFVKDILKSNSYPEGSNFQRCEDDGTKCNITCSKCSSDEYVRQGLCTGVFTAYQTDIKRGVLSCRCGFRYHWTREQYEYRISKQIKGEFIKWDTVFVNKRSKYVWRCEEGHINISNLYNTLTDLSGCPTCAVSGFSKSIPATFYIVRWYNDSVSYLKFGITNRDVIKRVKEQKCKAVDLDYTILYTFYHTEGSVVSNCESYIKKILVLKQMSVLKNYYLLVILKPY